MNLNMYDKIVEKYKSKSQIARILSEKWFYKEMYCPICLNSKVKIFPNNNKVSDFVCENCKNEYQLKSSKKKFNKKIVDGNYNTMISFIEKNKTPNFTLLQYSEDWIVKNLDLIPKFFINKNIIEKRKPLSSKAKRKGWIGCNILLEKIPESGKIKIIKNEKVIDKKIVNKKVRKVFFISYKKDKSWISTILKIVEEQKQTFTLKEMYKYKSYLKELFPENNNIKAKIRQQLQILRDNKIIEFKEKGVYKKI